MTRIYSPTKPSAVDVYFTYHHITRSESVEFDCRLMYRIHDPVSSKELDIPQPDIAPRPGYKDWKLVFELGLADLPPGPKWRPVDQTLWGLKEAEVSQLHTALFDSEDRSPVKEIDKVDTIRLLMATVGIPLGVARHEDEDDRQDPTEIATIQWEIDHYDWIALNIRKVCGVPLKKDAHYKPRSADEDDEWPDEDDEDEENDSDDD